MLATMLYESDIDTSVLDGKRAAVIGYGSQGHAHAINLKESGVDVVVGLREGSTSWAKAEEAGLDVMTMAQAAQASDIIMMLVPDMDQAQIFDEHIRPHMADGDMLMFAHGLAIHFELLVPPKGIDVAMIAPKGPGHRVRAQYVGGGGVPCLLAVHQDSTGRAWELAGAYGAQIGGDKGGLLVTTFKEETETDLFGEQTILVGLLAYGIRKTYDKLVGAGYQPEAAWFETEHEVKLIVDLIFTGGVCEMLDSISDTAKWGGMTIGEILLGGKFDELLDDVLKAIQDGSFVADWKAECEAGRPNFKRRLAEFRAHPMEAVGRRMRAHMPWISAGQTSVAEASGGLRAD